MSWWDHARCKGMDVNIFFRPKGESVAPAKAVCAECPVREECLEESLTAPFERWGVWGGLSERERRRLRRGRREQAIPQHGTRTMYEAQKCRCDECRQAHVDYQRKWRQSRGAA